MRLNRGWWESKNKVMDATISSWIHCNMFIKLLNIYLFKNNTLYFPLCDFSCAHDVFITWSNVNGTHGTHDEDDVKSIKSCKINLFFNMFLFWIRQLISFSVPLFWWTQRTEAKIYAFIKMEVSKSFWFCLLFTDGPKEIV